MKNILPIPGGINPVISFGVHDSNIHLIERILELKVHVVENNLVLEGKDGDIQIAFNVFQNLFKLSASNTPISHDELNLLIEESRKFGEYTLDNITANGLTISKKKKRVKPRTPHQVDYVNKILGSDVVFSVGPAGTGKTYLAVAVALHLLTAGRISRVILTRPVVEAGENLGFLPGTLEEKIDPYTRPLYDAIQEMLSPEEIRYYTETRMIELAPLAYMRGRTLSNAFIILDEAQNTTSSQMKMFLTRLGENSKMVITGDISQTDLPKDKDSGLQEAIELFKDIPDIEIVIFDKSDVVRHDLVKKIIEIYEKRDNI